MKTEVKVDTSIAVIQISRIRGNTDKGLRRVIMALSLLVTKGAQLAITSGPFRAIKTGYLRSSIFPQVNGLIGIIKPNTNYAGYIHWGTRFMRARPFMKGGVDLMMPEMKITATEQFKSSIL